MLPGEERIVMDMPLERKTEAWSAQLALTTASCTPPGSWNRDAACASGSYGTAAIRRFEGGTGGRFVTLPDGAMVILPS